MADKSVIGPPPTEGLTPEVVRWLKKVQDHIELGAGQRGNGEQRYLTVQDAQDLGLADVVPAARREKAVSLSPRAFAGTGMGDLTLQSGSSIVNLSPPLPVENVEAYGTNEGASSSVLVMWEGTRYPTYGGANVYRATENSYGKAVKIGSVGLGARMYLDEGVNEAVTYYYWVRSVSTVSGAPEGPLNQVPGTEAIFDEAEIEPAATANAVRYQQHMAGINAATALFGEAEVTNLLIGGTIKSDNYVPGVSGWIIKK